MKKSVTIFLVLLYASTAIGTVINFHYCKGHLARISLMNDGGNTGCGCNPENMPKECCKDVIRLEKADNHKTAQYVSLLNIPAIPVELLIGSDLVTIFQANYVLPLGNDFALRRSPEPIYLLNKVFLI